MASSFQQAVEEIYDLSLFHAALFILGLAFNMAPQKALKPAGPCADKLYTHYEYVVRVTTFFVLTTFCTAGISGHVKRRVPEGGLHGVAGTWARALLRLNAALGCVLSAGSTVLAVASSTFLLQAKTGVWQCQPAAVRAGVYIIYAIIVYAMSTVYLHVARSIVLSD